MSSEEVDKLKDEGNKLFAAKEWLKSASKYTQAIKADPNNAVLYSNRSAALLKLLKVTKATEDADTCIKLKPEWEKGYFRKGAILEEQDKLGEAMEVYQVALKLVPESKELSQKIHSLRNQINKKAKSAKLSAAVDPAGTKDGAARSAAGGKDTDSKDTVKGSKEGQPRSSSAKGSKGSSKEGHAGAPKPPPQQPQVGPSQPAQDNRGNDVVYDDLGSIEVAKFAEEFLGVLRDDIEEGTVIPTVHFLPGRKLKSSEEAEAHVRIAGAFESPDTLASLTDFLRQKGGQLQAQAVLAVVPKSDIAFPRVWDKPKWPGGEKQGIFAQLETPTLRKLWFIPTQGKKAETALAADFDRFSLLPRLLKT